MSDTLARSIPQPIDDDHREQRVPSDVTRRLCAGVYVDRSFRDQIIGKIHNDARRRIAPSYGFDLVPVVRHAWWSWLIDSGQLLAMLTGLLGNLAMDGVLAAVTVWCVIALCLLLRGIIWVAPQVLRLQMEVISERWGRTSRGSLRRRFSDSDLRSRKRQLKAMLLGCLLVTPTPFVISVVLGVPMSSAIRPAIATGCVLLGCAIATAVTRQLKLNGLARAQTVRPAALTRRETVTT